MAARNVIEIILNAEDKASSVVQSVTEKITGRLEGLSRGLIGAGLALGVAVAPAAGYLYNAVDAASSFDASMTNVQAILKSTDEEMTGLSQSILDLGANSIYGPQSVADAMYEIASGVPDASTHMAILEASVATATAGMADLGSTTSAMIGTMNAYGFEADKAAFVSDVLTQIVGAGVGSMDEFASALPSVTPLANSLSIGLDELGASMAYITTQGPSASEAGTQLRAMMTSLINPNETMIAAFEELGVASGEQLVEMYGLAGAYQELSKRSPTFSNNMAKAAGSVEALSGALILSTEDAEAFAETFIENVEGATAATEAIQMESFSNQMALLKSQFQAISITVGMAVIPVLLNLFNLVKPLIGKIMEWVQGNTELISKIAVVVGAVAGLSAVLTGVGAAIGVVAGLFAVLTSPIGLVVMAIAALGYAYETNLGGFKDFIDGQVVPAVQNLIAVVMPIFQAIGGWLADQLPGAVAAANTGFSRLGIEIGAMPSIVEQLVPALAPIATLFAALPLPISLVVAAVAALGYAYKENLGGFKDFIDGQVVPAVQNLIAVVMPIFQAIGGWMADQLPGVIATAKTAWDGFKTGVETVWNWISQNIIPEMQRLVGWLAVNMGIALAAAASFWTNTLQPALDDVVGFITDKVIPGIGDLAGAITTGLTTAVRAAGSVFGWLGTYVFAPIANFVAEALMPAFDDIAGWAQNTIGPAIETAQKAFEAIWNLALEPLALWINETFIAGPLQSIYDFASQHLPYAIDLFEVALNAIWNDVLIPVADWIANDLILGPLTKLKTMWEVGFPAAMDVATIAFKAIWDKMKEIGAWIVDTFIAGPFTNIKTWLETNLPNAVDTFKTFLQGLIDKFTEVATFITGFIADTITPLTTAWSGISTVIGDISGAIDTFIDKAKGIAGAVPDWLIPGSPTPFEIGLWGVAGAFDDLARKSLPSFAAEFAPVAGAVGPGGFSAPVMAGAGSGGGGMVISGGVFNIYGVQDVEGLYDELQQVKSRRAF